ncbi:MAG: NAD(P)-dependent oxidoreductase [Planctomycetota bacterium]|jgi:D-3-phosphoglycerate dehydrogenase
MASSTPTTIVDADAGASTRQSAMTVLIADKFDQTGIEQLEAIGCRVQFSPNLTADDVPAAVSENDPDVLIVRSTKVLTAAVEAAHRLSLIVRAGAGYDTIDVASASARGIFVANCPGMNAIAVAELAWALILTCDRRVPDQCADVRSGTWNKKEYAKKAGGLYGRTLGIVGLGRIGLEVAQRGKAFGMKVIAWSNSLTEDRAHELGLGYCSNLINLAKLADVISVHVAATPETKCLIGDKFCSALKPGAYLINTSRGSVVDETALTEAIRTKDVRAGLDVYANEPGAATGQFTNPIVQEPGVYGTHHVGASTDQAQQAIADEVVRIIDTYARTGTVPNCVNRAKATSATSLLTVRHLNRPGVLAHVFYTLGQAGINVQEMENIIYDGAQAACARIQLDEPPKPEHISAIRANDDVLSVALSQMKDEA